MEGFILLGIIIGVGSLGGVYLWATDYFFKKRFPEKDEHENL